MSTHTTIEATTRELLRCADAVRAGTGHDADVASLAAELDALAEALRGAANACDTAARRMAPALTLDGDVSRRYRHAAATWHTTPAPSDERLPPVLARVHEAAGAIRLAARRCDRARVDIDAALGHPTRPSPGP